MRSVTVGQLANLMLCVAIAGGGCGTKPLSPMLVYTPIPNQKVTLQFALLFKDRAAFDEAIPLLQVERVSATEKPWLRDMISKGRAMSINYSHLPVEILSEEGDAVQVKLGSGSTDGFKDPQTYGKVGYVHSAWILRPK